MRVYKPNETSIDDLQSLSGYCRVCRSRHSTASPRMEPWFPLPGCQKLAVGVEERDARDEAFPCGKTPVSRPLNVPKNRPLVRARRGEEFARLARTQIHSRGRILEGRPHCHVPVCNRWAPSPTHPTTTQIAVAFERPMDSWHPARRLFRYSAGLGVPADLELQAVEAIDHHPFGEKATQVTPLVAPERAPALC